MTIQELNPYVRFARRREFFLNEAEHIAYDHRIFVIEKGCAWFYLNDQCYKLEKGDVIFWRAGIRYRVELAPDTEVSGCNFDFVRRDNTVLLPMIPSSTDAFSGKLEEAADFSDTRVFDSCFCIYNTYSLLPKFHEIYEEFEAKQMFFDQRCSALLKDILVLCMRFSGRNYSSASAQVTQEVLGYIKENYRSPLTNELFSRLFHYHPNHISQLIKSQTGLPLHRYIRTYRVHMALDLLQSTELTLAEIAEQVGLGDIHQFSKAFKQVIGLPPSSFRKR